MALIKKKLLLTVLLNNKNIEYFRKRIKTKSNEYLAFVSIIFKRREKK